ncbi:MAG: hypothetical protein FJX23_03795 [Alphaproteobacteria bacterium]|nr:hypothetical protein [Alphaproteobacteria bacterium]
MQEPNTARERTARRAMSVVSAEATGLGVSFGALFLAKKLAGKERMDHLKDWVAKKIVMPLMKNGVPMGAAEAGAEADATQENPQAFTPISQEEKARKIANSIVDMSILVPVGIAARLGVQKTMDDKFGAPATMQNYVFSRVVDSSVGAAALVGMTTLGKAPSKAMTDKLAGVLGKVGLEAETADSIAKFTVYAQVPNVAGMSANLATLHALDKKNVGR